MDTRATQPAITDDKTNPSNVGPISSSRPRPRPVLSCLRCRHRKIKCDRLLPCKQRSMAGQANQCRYKHRPMPGANGPQTYQVQSSVAEVIGDSLVEPQDQDPQTLVDSTISTEGILKPNTLSSLIQRLERLERLHHSYSSNLSDKSKNETYSKDTNGHPRKADAALSMKPSGPRYHSQSYKKLLFHHVSPLFCRVRACH